MRYLALLFALAFAATALAAGKDTLPPITLFNAAPLSGAAVTGNIAPATSAAIDIRSFDNVGVQLNVGTTSPAATGLYFIDVSEDYNAQTANAGNWTTLSFTSQASGWAVAAVTGTPAAVFYNATPAAVFYREVNQTGAAYLRVRYVPTATGSGVFSAYLTGKGL